MAARVRTSAKIKALLAMNPKNAELWDTLTTIKRRSGPHAGPLNDRARIVLAASILDQHLQTALLSHFPIIDTENREEMAQLFEGDSAPLSSFSARIRVGYALGIFGPKTKQDLERIKNIRNVCAHSRVPVHFRDSAITEECMKFHALEYLKRKTVLGPKPKTAEQCFFVVVYHYFMCLVVEEPEGELPTPLRYRLSPLGSVFG